MRTLYYNTICPLSRQIKIILSELNLDCLSIVEDYWLRNVNFITLNPEGTLPVLIEPSGLTISGIYTIIEYLLEKYPSLNLMPEELEEKIEPRRMLQWLNNKFYREVTSYLIEERIVRPIVFNEGPRTNFLRAAKINLKNHLIYFTKLIDQNGYIASDRITIADLCAASHISVIDYFNEIYWDHYSSIKDWYLILKSRPSFQPILNELFRGITPGPQYKSLDF
jgi:glutathione S-transferase